jgi:N-acetylmuramoyl-L-alanine amidase
MLTSSVWAFDWTLIKQNGWDYVPLADVQRFYGFVRVEHVGDITMLSSSTLRLQAAPNSKELYLNGIKFILSLPVIEANNQTYISRLDLSKLVEPVLRPAKIQTAPVHTIVLDAGHGGYDFGACGLLGNEKSYTLDVVSRARQLLTKAGFNVKLTRATDVFVPLETRARFASRQLNALFISVHFNFGQIGASGIETYCMAPQGVPASNDAGISLIEGYSGNLRDQENIALATGMHSSLMMNMHVYDRGIKRARFVVLRDLTIPGILVEGGFLSNPQDAVRVATPVYRQKLAESIVRGVLAYNKAVRQSQPATPVLAKKPLSIESDPPIWDLFK